MHLQLTQLSSELAYHGNNSPGEVSCTQLSSELAGVNEGSPRRRLPVYDGKPERTARPHELRGQGRHRPARS
jgi:hypothetical protein